MDEETAGTWDEDSPVEGDFTYKMPPNIKGKHLSLDDPIDFGVAPNDPRFYENTRNTEVETGRRVIDENFSDSMEKSSDEGQAPYMRIKDPLIVNPKPDPNAFLKSQQMQGLLHKWGRNNNNNNLRPVPVGQGPEVVQRPVNMTEQTSISLYGVALIAGVSAAITIALIALGIGWWT